MQQLKKEFRISLGTVIKRAPRYIAEFKKQVSDTSISMLIPYKKTVCMYTCTCVYIYLYICIKKF